MILALALPTKQITILSLSLGSLVDGPHPDSNFNGFNQWWEQPSHFDMNMKN